MELALKAFLVHHGFTEKRLRAISHDLVAAFAAAEANGFRMAGGNAQTRDQWLEVLNFNYSRTRAMWGIAVTLWGEATWWL